MSLRLKYSGVLILSLALMGSAAAQVKITEVMDLRAAYPLGGQRGQTVPITLIGKHIDAPTRVLVEGSGIEVRSLKGVSSTEASAEFILAPDAPLGPVSIRLVGKFGVTDPVPFMIGRLPEIREEGANNAPSEAPSIPHPVVVNGRFSPAEDIDCYRFNAQAGRPLVLAVESYVLDATHSVGEGRGRRNVDPVMRIYDAGGRLVEECEDFHTPDPLLVFRAPNDGEYVVEVRDLGYEGNVAASYRLTVTEKPWATSIYPAGAQRGQSVEVDIRNAAGDTPLKARVAAGGKADHISNVAPLETLANTRPFLVGDLPERLEAEPNDSAQQANPAAVGMVFNGRLEKEGDVDSFALNLAQGEAVSIEVLADRVLASPVDLTLLVVDEKGKQVAGNDDSGLAYGLASRDPALHFAAPAAGRYSFLLRDVAGRGDPDCVYRVTITRLEKGFHLTTWWDNVLLKGGGGTGAFLALIRREHGFQGPVRVRVKGLPPGYQGSEGIITSAQTTVLMTITAPPDAQPGTVVPFYLEGEALVDGKPLVKRSLPRAQRDQDGETIWRPSGGCVAAVGPVTEFQLHTPVRDIAGSAGDTLTIPVKIDRIAGYDAPFALNAVQCVFSLGGSPAQFKGTMPVPKGARELDFKLELPKNLPAGEYTFALIRGMGHDYRIDRPYPSTPLIHLTVKGVAK